MKIKIRKMIKIKSKIKSRIRSAKARLFGS